MLPIMGIFLVCLVGLYWLIPTLIQSNAEQEATISAQRTATQFKIVRAYYTKNVISKIVGKHDIKGSINHESEPNSIPLPATMIHNLSKDLQEKDINLKLYSGLPFPNRSSRVLDDFAKTAWERLSNSSANADVFSRTEMINNEPFVRVAVADRMVAAACVACHNSHPDTPKNNWALNDVRGVLEVSVPIASQIANGKTTSLYIIGVLFAFLLILLTSLFIIYRSTIGNRLNILANTLHDIAAGEGDLTKKLNANGKHELSRVGASFNLFTEKLSGTITAIQQSSQELTSISTSLQHIQLKNSKSISLQDNETFQVSSAVEELSSTALNIAENATKTADATTNTEKATQEGFKTVELSITSTQELANNIEQATVAATTLQEDSKNIGNVLSVISEIAEQTNLLALNAAIEAARAGEQGRGFAVVADEVRTLAGRTQESTEKIKGIVESLQSSTKTMSNMMSTSEEQAQTTVSLVENVGQQLRGVLDQVETISSMNIQIATASEEQGTVVEKVNSNVNAIREVSNQNLELTQVTEQEIEKLLTQVEALNQLASHFKI